MKKRLVWTMGATLGLALLLAPAAPAGLIGRWTFNETAGATAIDSSGYGNDATIYGATRVATPGYRGVSLDGIDDWVVGRFFWVDGGDLLGCQAGPWRAEAFDDGIPWELPLGPLRAHDEVHRLDEEARRGLRIAAAHPELAQHFEEESPFRAFHLRAITRIEIVRLTVCYPKMFGIEGRHEVQAYVDTFHFHYLRKEKRR